MQKVGRPPYPGGGRRDARLLDIATTLFMERGFDGTFIDAVAEAAGVSKTPLSSLDMEDRLRVEDLKKAGLDLFDAVVVAEKYGSGKAIGGGLDKRACRSLRLRQPQSRACTLRCTHTTKTA